MKKKTCSILGLAALGKLSEAISYFDKALSIDPNNKGALEDKQRAEAELMNDYIVSYSYIKNPRFFTIL
ncbi:MAG: tetratricopeptide repeat protein [Nitrososphaeraceae archaeon]